MAVSGLRGVLAGNGMEDDFLSPVSPSGSRSLRIETEEGVDVDLLRRIQDALQKSSDEGDTLDLSRRGIRKIGEEATEMFRTGVGKEKRGVWR